MTEPEADKGFYVEEGCCTACGMPHDIAPTLFGWAGNICYLKRQPENEEEIAQAIEALSSSELDCIRYGGRSESVLRRIAETGNAYLADSRSAASYPQVERLYAEFEAGSEFRGPYLLAATLAGSFAEFIDARVRYRVRRSSSMPTRVEICWFENYWHEVTFGAGNQNRMAILLRPQPGADLGLRRAVADWADAMGLDLIWYGRTVAGGEEVEPRRSFL